MSKYQYDKELMWWVKDHYWDKLEKDKELILRHLKTFMCGNSSAGETDDFRTALECIASGTVDQEPPYRSAPREELMRYAAKILSYGREVKNAL